MVDRNIRKHFCHLRSSADNLPIEKGRHRRLHMCQPGVPAEERVCQLCNDNLFGVEVHDDVL